MVQTKAFSYNPTAQYQPARVYKIKDLDIIDQTIEFKQSTHSSDSSGSNFKAKFPDIFAKYVLPYVESDAIVQNWRQRPMQFWQNQLNFALWCATAGCGVSVGDHLSGDIPAFARSMFLFHVYYQTRRILFELKAALPTASSWNAFNNYDKKAYERICNEFGVSASSNWRQSKDHNQGLGDMYNYFTGIGYHPYYGEYDSKSITFTQATSNSQIHVDYIAQKVSNAWSTFMLDNSNGFTRPGVERINDSIRTYCWAILGSQSQIKSDILGIGSAFDAQKQFLANVEDGIQRSIDLPSQITRYQNTLKYARSKVDYVFGFGLYMAPSNMELRIGTIEGYNNKIILSTHDQKLWWNETVNLPASATSYSDDVSGTKTRKSTPVTHITPHTAPTDPQKPLKLDIPPAAQGKKSKT